MKKRLPKSGLQNKAGRIRALVLTLVFTHGANCLRSWHLPFEGCPGSPLLLPVPRPPPPVLPYARALAAVSGPARAALLGWTQDPVCPILRSGPPHPSGRTFVATSSLLSLSAGFPEGLLPVRLPGREPP